MTYEQALAYLTEHGQEHLLRYYDQLTPEQQAHLLEQIEGLQLERPQFQNRDAAAQKRGSFAPLGAATLEQIAEKSEEYREIGLRAIRSAGRRSGFPAGIRPSQGNVQHGKDTGSVYL